VDLPLSELLSFVKNDLKRPFPVVINRRTPRGRREKIENFVMGSSLYHNIRLMDIARFLEEIGEYRNLIRMIITGVWMIFSPKLCLVAISVS
jgi:hypothetical protein